MKTIKKIILIGLILVVVLGIAAVVLIGMSFDKIVKAGIETVAPTITQTTVRVDSVKLSPLSGAASISGLVVGNPNGFKSETSITLGKAAVKVAPGSLITDKIIVHSVEIRGPEINLEGNPFGNNNLQKILDNVNAFAGGPNTNQPAATGEKKPGKKLQVDDFLITGTKVTARISGMENEPFTITLPDIHFTSLGTGPDGITAADLTKRVLNEIITGSIKGVGDHAQKAFGKTAGNILKGGADTAGKAVSEGANAVKKGLNSLFGK